MTMPLTKTAAIPKTAQAACGMMHYRNWRHLTFWGLAASVLQMPPDRADDLQRVRAKKLAEAIVEST